MKKILALLMAAVTVTATAATAFAQTSDQATLSFGESEGVTLEESLLTPGKEYRFPLQITQDGKTEAFTKEHMDGRNLRLENLKGKDAISSAKLVESGKQYYLELTTKAGWPTKQSDVTYRVRYMDKSSGKVVDTLETSFAVGYEVASDYYLDTIAAGDHVQVDEKAPVFTKEQLEKLADLNNYKKVIFAADDWTFEASVNGMGSINMLNNTKAVEDILEKFPGNDFKFLTFPAGPTFKGNAQLKVDVSDIAEDFEGKFYVYRYLSGKLTKVGFSFDKEEEILTIPTNQLGRFVITDKEIADGTVIFESGSSSGQDSSSSGGSSSSGSTNGTKPNPDTGAASGFAGASIALLAGACALVLRRKK